jgi:hypothetical protein
MVAIPKQDSQFGHAIEPNSPFARLRFDDLGGA